MISVDGVIIVEGKYDKIKLENIVDALIIPTNGFGIFKDKEKCEMLKCLSEHKKIIILTDSDSAGMVIRSHLKGILPQDSIINVYVPQLHGKERRKKKYSAEGLLGVEGIDDELILASLKKAGVWADKTQNATDKITKTDLMRHFLTYYSGSSERRKMLLEYMNLPKNMSTNTFTDYLNAVYGKEKFEEVVRQWESIKN